MRGRPLRRARRTRIVTRTVSDGKLLRSTNKTLVYWAQVLAAAWIAALASGHETSFVFVSFHFTTANFEAGSRGHLPPVNPNFSDGSGAAIPSGTPQRGVARTARVASSTRPDGVRPDRT